MTVVAVAEEERVDECALACSRTLPQRRSCLREEPELLA